MSDVNLLIPLADAIEWDEQLTESMSEEADRLEIGYDGGEEEGRYESHLFLETDAQTVVAVARAALARHGLGGHLRIVSPTEVVLEPDSSQTRAWLEVQSLPGPYGRAVKELCRSLNARQQNGTWLHERDYDLLTIRQVPGGAAPPHFQGAPADGSPGELFVIAPVDLSIYEPRSQLDARAVARHNMLLVLEQVASHLETSLPPIPELGRTDT
jgi:hypothetical protein